MTIDDLQSFCSTDYTRYYLKTPFSVGNFSYATNGHIIVRLPRRDDVPENPQAPETLIQNIARPFNGIDAVEFSALPVVELPRATEIDCSDCDGRGFEHDCPDCECICENCGGSGKMWEPTSLTIRGSLYALRYIDKIYGLKDLSIYVPKDSKAPMLFRFAGGEGALMPLSRKLHNHIDPFADLQHS